MRIDNREWLEADGLGGFASATGSGVMARRRFFERLSEHLREAGLGHVSETADAEPPFTPRGCPFQAWPPGELIGIERDMLAPRSRAASQWKGEPQWA